MKKKPPPSPHLELKEFIGLKYMARFRCICADCEDICCKNWKIAVDGPHYKKLEKLMSTTKVDRDKFKASMERVKDTKRPQLYAFLKFRSDGTCSFLSKDSLCTIHQDYGEPVLFDTCSTYPRKINIIGERVELASTLSCPETARLCLLPEDATELIKIKPHPLPQNAFTAALKLPNSDPFLNHVGVISNAVFKLLSLRQYSIIERLFFCVYFSDRISSFYYKDTTNFSKDSLAKEISRTEDPAALEDLHMKFNALKIPNNLITTIVQSVLVLNIKDSFNTGLGQMALGCLKSYQAVGNVTGNGPIELLISCEKLWEGYEERRAFWASSYGERIDVYFTNYCRNSWIKDLYVCFPDLNAYFRMMLVYFAILRFLFFSHPDLLDLQKKLHDSSVDKSIVIDTLDKIIVKVTYLFAKQIEHNKPLLEHIQNILEESDIKKFVYLVLLLKY